MIKPRIIQLSPGMWECACDLVFEHGATAKLAYDRWLKSALADAVAKLQPVEGPEVAILRKIESPISESGHRKDYTAKPKAGKPITIKATPKLPPAKYHQSVVRTVPGTVATKEYRPPAGLLLNQRRAEQAEPKLSPLASDIRFEKRVEL